MALTVFHKMNKNLNCAITICACLKNANAFKLKYNFKNYPSHKICVRIFEENIEPKMGVDERQRILTLRPIFDEVVPVETTTVKGTVNKRILSIEHDLSINIAFLFYSNLIREFILD